MTNSRVKTIPVYSYSTFFLIMWTFRVWSLGLVHLTLMIGSGLILRDRTFLNFSWSIRPFNSEVLFRLLSKLLNRWRFDSCTLMPPSSEAYFSASLVERCSSLFCCFEVLCSTPQLAIFSARCYFFFKFNISLYNLII